MTDNPTREPGAEPVQAGWHLWLAGILGILWNGFGCFDFAMTAGNNEAYLGSFPEEMTAYWQAMPVWMWALWALGVFGGLAGSVALLLRSKLAAGLFAVSLVAAGVSMGLGMMDPDAPRMEGSEVFTALILAIAAGLFAYAWWQNRRGVLR